MVEPSSTEYNSLTISPNVNAQQFRLNKISEVRDYFTGEIKERELMSKRLSKYIASFEYFHKSLIVLSVTTGSISMICYLICNCYWSTCRNNNCRF